MALDDGGQTSEARKRKAADVEEASASASDGNEDGSSCEAASASVDLDALGGELFAPSCKVEHSASQQVACPSPFKGFSIKPASIPESWAASSSSSGHATTPRSDTADGAMGATLLSASRLAALAAESNEIGPSPADFKRLNVQLKAKAKAKAEAIMPKADAKAKAKAEATPKADAKAKAVMRRPSAAPVRRKPASAAERSDVEADAEAAKMAFDPDPIAKYLDVDAIGVDLAVIQKRLHSHVWHSAVKKHTLDGLTQEQAKLKGAEEAALHVDRWREKVGLPPIVRRGVADDAEMKIHLEP
eukprot:9490819-Pyramimonas_sp.AAC.1